MESLFVPYELSVKLKNLGFDEPCFKYWNCSFAIGDKTKTLSLFKNENVYSVPAPLYQQAFRWFREKYNLHCGINTHTSSTNQVTYVIDLEFGKKLTYEEAELATLKGLIEIVESK